MTPNMTLAYKDNTIKTASPAELTLMLYDGAIKFCNIALAGFESIDDLEAYYVKTCGRDDVPAEILEQTVREVSTNESKCKLPPFPVNEAVLRRIAGI